MYTKTKKNGIGTVTVDFRLWILIEMSHIFDKIVMLYVPVMFSLSIQKT